jgi:hypothetical protein
VADSSAHNPPAPDDLRAWRKQLREMLLAQRLALSPETLQAYRAAIDGHLEHGFPSLARGVVARKPGFRLSPE